jgi:hypothetical protein
MLSSLLPLDSLFSSLVISFSFLRITKCFISNCNLLEFLFGSLWIVLVLVGMELNS